MPFRMTARAGAASALAVTAALSVLPPAHAASDNTPLRPNGVAQQIVQRIPGPLAQRATTPIPSPATVLGPGSYLVIDRGPNDSVLCSAGYVFASGSELLLSAAGHCFLPTGKVATHGPDADFDASSVRVSACVESCFFGGQSGVLNNLIPLGPVRYARQQRGRVQVGEDFGLVAIPAGTQVRPTIPVWGGPSSVTSLNLGDGVCLYGNATGVAETYLTAARAGVGIFSDDTTWGADIPSAPGDSGTAVETCRFDADGVHPGGAVGVLTHLVAGDFAFVEGTTIAQAQRLAAEAGLNIGNPLTF